VAPAASPRTPRLPTPSKAADHAATPVAAAAGSNGKGTPAPAGAQKAQAHVSYEERKRQEADARRERKAVDARRRRIEELESRIAERETTIKEIEASMSAPGFYENHEAAKPVIDRHQALMWEVGDLMSQWEELQHQTDP
jgi:ATP-binding cassette subfamily F protein 3